MTNAKRPSGSSFQKALESQRRCATIFYRTICRQYSTLLATPCIAFSIWRIRYRSPRWRRICCAKAASKALARSRQDSVPIFWKSLKRSRRDGAASRSQDKWVAQGYTTVTNRLMRDQSVSYSARFVFILLLSRRIRGDKVFPGQSTIAREMGVSEKDSLEADPRSCARPTGSLSPASAKDDPTDIP